MRYFDGRQSDACGAGRMAESPSGFPENTLDVVHGSPIDLGDLGNRHAVFYQSADARLRARDLDRRRRGCGRTFRLIVPGGCRRRDAPQHTRFARRWGGGGDLLNCWRADGPFRGEQGFGGLGRSADPLAIMAARIRLVLSAKQELLRVIDFVRDYRRGDSVILASWTWEAGARSASSAALPQPESDNIPFWKISEQKAR
jgi:hypothetical protein